MGRNHTWHRNHPLLPLASADEAIACYLRHAANCGCHDIPEDVMAELDARRVVLPQGCERRWAAVGSVGAPQAPELTMTLASGSEALRQSGLQL